MFPHQEHKVVSNGNPSFKHAFGETNKQHLISKLKLLCTPIDKISRMCRAHPFSSATEPERMRKEDQRGGTDLVTPPCSTESEEAIRDVANKTRVHTLRTSQGEKCQ